MPGLLPLVPYPQLSAWIMVAQLKPGTATLELLAIPFQNGQLLIIMSAD